MVVFPTGDGDRSPRKRRRSMSAAAWIQNIMCQEKTKILADDIGVGRGARKHVEAIITLPEPPSRASGERLMLYRSIGIGTE